MIEDNSKLTKNQPPVVINSISLIDKDGEFLDIPLTGETIEKFMMIWNIVWMIVNIDNMFIVLYKRTSNHICSRY